MTQHAENRNAVIVSTAEPMEKECLGKSRMSAMIVDDSHKVRHAVRQMIEKMGFRVTTAIDGADALFKFQRSAHDLLLTDLQMPVINGYQLARKVKMAYPDTKVAIMTGLNPFDVNEMTKDVMIDGWLFKPFGFHELKSMLMTLKLPHIDDII